MSQKGKKCVLRRNPVHPIELRSLQRTVPRIFPSLPSLEGENHDSRLAGESVRNNRKNRTNPFLFSLISYSILCIVNPEWKLKAFPQGTRQSTFAFNLFCFAFRKFHTVKVGKNLFTIDLRYKIQRAAGSGSYGVVVAAEDIVFVIVDCSKIRKSIVTSQSRRSRTSSRIWWMPSESLYAVQRDPISRERSSYCDTSMVPPIL